MFGNEVHARSGGYAFTNNKFTRFVFEIHKSVAYDVKVN